MIRLRNKFFVVHNTLAKARWCGGIWKSSALNLR